MAFLQPKSQCDKLQQKRLHRLLRANGNHVAHLGNGADFGQMRHWKAKIWRRELLLCRCACQRLVLRLCIRCNLDYNCNSRWCRSTPVVPRTDCCDAPPQLGRKFHDHSQAVRLGQTNGKLIPEYPRPQKKIQKYGQVRWKVTYSVTIVDSHHHYRFCHIFCT